MRRVCPRPRQWGQAGRATRPPWPTLQRDWSDSRCAGARGGGLTSAQVAVLLGPPSVSQPPPASPLLPEPFRRLCHTGDSWLHPAWLETVTFSADCRGCRHTGLAWPQAYRGASSPAVCLGETPAPLHGAGGRGVSGAWPGIVEMPGVWMQRGPWRCGVQGEGLGENLPAPCPSPSHITLGPASRRCFSPVSEGLPAPVCPAAVCLLSLSSPTGLWPPRACTSGAERPKTREANTGDLT